MSKQRQHCYFEYRLKTSEYDRNNFISFSFNEGYRDFNVIPTDLEGFVNYWFDMLLENGKLCKIGEEIPTVFIAVDCLETARNLYVKNFLEAMKQFGGEVKMSRKNLCASCVKNRRIRKGRNFGQEYCLALTQLIGKIGTCFAHSDSPKFWTEYTKSKNLYLRRKNNGKNKG